MRKRQPTKQIESVHLSFKVREEMLNELDAAVRRGSSGVVTRSGLVRQLLRDGLDRLSQTAAATRCTTGARQVGAR